MIYFNIEMERNTLNVTQDIRVVELFAGVGGFRLGLEKSSARFKTIWANQWEPNKKLQHAFNCYVSNFGENPNHINEDIALVKDLVPDHDLLVGGFPCQDYSVARTGAKGMEGKKGVLWWHINDIVTNKKPSFVLLENVDRLLKSPTSQRGRDFGVILRCFNDLGYAVEWRVINAAEYGHAQRRRRTFIFAYKNNQKIYQKLASHLETEDQDSYFNWINKDGFFATTFPVEELHNKKKMSSGSLGKEEFKDLADFSNEFAAAFFNSGVMIDGKFYSEEMTPITVNPTTLGEIQLKDEVDPKYFLNGSLEKWNQLKGSKKIPRVKPNGEEYFYSEGSMAFPDRLDLPARTMLTSETSVNRSTHVIEDFKTKKLRLLTPVEAERLNGFPDNWTDTGMPEKFRYFTMGNALVVPVITSIGEALLDIL